MHDKGRFGAPFYCLLLRGIAAVTDKLDGDWHSNCSSSVRVISLTEDPMDHLLYIAMSGAKESMNSLA
ncbi:hypothetical protein, partial [Aeromonas dhakensis]|uniref:hypothetical protein n=1 Tax=Aeromonas dhakensis TaxID=196024 RepID=UPI003BA22D61